MLITCAIALALPGAALARTDTLTYTAAGEYTFTVPAWAVPPFQVTAVGGHGGFAYGSGTQPPGGRGEKVTASLTVHTGEVLYLEVGGNGTDCQVAIQACGGGGGGASDVRTAPASAGLTPTDPRLLVAAGGGGGGMDGGAGGDAGAAGANGSGIGLPGGGAAGVPDGTGAGGAPAGGGCGLGGGNGTLGAGGGGAYSSLGGNTVGGGANGGGDGGNQQESFNGGGGGGGLNGGGGGGGGPLSTCNGFGAPFAGGGGGGSSLVPTGGSKTIDTTGQPLITISYTDTRQVTATSAVSAPSSDTAGTALAASSISATLSGGTSPTGTVTWTVFGPQASAPTSCATGGTTVATAAVTGNGTYHPPAAVTLSSGAGNYWWYASYSGDSANTDSASTCGAGMPETTVTALQPSLSLSVPASDVEGNPIAADAISPVLSGSSIATGTVTVYVFGPQATGPTDCQGWQQVGTASVNGNGTYHPSGGFTPVTGPGNYFWYATYNGDANDSSAPSTCGAGMAETTVTAAQLTVSLSAPSSGTAGTAIPGTSITGTLSGGFSPTGTLTFRVFGPQTSAPSTCSSGGTTVGSASASDDGTYHSSAAFTPSTRGTYWWYASYGGDGNNAGAGTACGTGMPSLTVPGLATSLSLAVPSSGTTGTAIPAPSVSAGLSGGSSPSGTITFTVFGPQPSPPTSCSVGGTTVGTALASGDGAVRPPAAFTPSAAGDYWWYASYGGDAINAPSSSACGPAMVATTVTGSTTTTTSSPSISRHGARASWKGRAVVIDTGYRLTCPTACRAAVSAKSIVPASLTTARRKGTTQSLIFGSAAFRIRAGDHAELVFTLNREGLRALQKLGKVKMTITVTVVEGSKRVTKSETVLFRLPKKPKPKRKR